MKTKVLCQSPGLKHGRSLHAAPAALTLTDDHDIARLTVNTLGCRNRRVPSRECQLLISKLNPEPSRGPAKSWQQCDGASQSGPQNHLTSSTNHNEDMVIQEKNGVFFPSYSDASYDNLGNTTACCKVSILDYYD